MLFLVLFFVLLLLLLLLLFFASRESPANKSSIAIAWSSPPFAGTADTAETLTSLSKHISRTVSIGRHLSSPMGETSNPFGKQPATCQARIMDDVNGPCSCPLMSTYCQLVVVAAAAAVLLISIRK